MAQAEKALGNLFVARHIGRVRSVKITRDNANPWFKASKELYVEQQEWHRDHDRRDTSRPSALPRLPRFFAVVEMERWADLSVAERLAADVSGGVKG